MKRALITGGTKGIGLAVCRLFSEKGYEVVALYSSDEKAAEEARKLLPAVTFLKADVSDMGAVKSVFDGINSLDVLVNNAGISTFSQVQDITEEEWARVMNTNAGGTFHCSKFAVKKMLEKGGAIVNIASIWGEVGGSCESAYSASKGAVIAFTKALAKELAPSNIRVNCVSPGAVETEMNARLTAEEKKAFCEEVPLGRFATPEEIATAVLFLAEHEYITGEVLSVNGGYGIS